MPVQIQGRSYATVAERLSAAHAYEPWGGIRSVDTTFESVASYVVCHAIVTFGDGRRFHGSAEVTPGTGRGPQSQAPLETAQTSAVGRALAFALWPGSESGLAGAEEILVAQSRPHRQAAPVAPAPAPEVDDRLESLRWLDESELLPGEQAPARRPQSDDGVRRRLSPVPAPEADDEAPVRSVRHTDEPATEAQVNVITSVARQLGRAVDVQDLTRGQASALIDELYAQRQRAGGRSVGRATARR
jgi:hypothetical protein